MIGNRLKELRESKGLTRKVVAEFIKIDQTTYGKYELNKREPDVETLKKLANFFGVSVDYIVCHKYEAANDNILIINDDELINKVNKVKEYIIASIYIAFGIDINEINDEEIYKKIVKVIRMASALTIEEIEQKYSVKK